MATVETATLILIIAVAIAWGWLAAWRRGLVSAARSMIRRKLNERVLRRAEAAVEGEALRIDVALDEAPPESVSGAASAAAATAAALAHALPEADAEVELNDARSKTSSRREGRTGAVGDDEAPERVLRASQNVKGLTFWETPVASVAYPATVKLENYLQKVQALEEQQQQRQRQQQQQAEGAEEEHAAQHASTVSTAWDDDDDDDDDAQSMARAAFLAGGAGGRRVAERRADLNDIPVEPPGAAEGGGDDDVDEGRWDAAGLLDARLRRQLQLRQREQDFEQQHRSAPYGGFD